ncbi:transposase [Parafrankia sp. EAN1pec]|uniref:transposase n=1 Tax=Parafrankia sp. (strain EAN1pec) TaxID=298653 RepID=UPI000054445B|nr:transposase [Frankia sp. EAN1pec]
MLGIRPVDPTPDEATLRRLLARVDRDALAAALLGDITLAPDGGSPAAVVVDGKTSRGARRPAGTQVHLLGAAAHGTGLLAGQVEVENPAITS